MKENNGGMTCNTPAMLEIIKQWRKEPHGPCLRIISVDPKRELLENNRNKVSDTK
ncbi:hypothetical protein [Breznakia pachnodae]|uniref:Uncharacterized protein n=1 Tax=Breznakia pachnodae TaxID=265178 RepID=A0ABU0E6Z6_9FIRM|nr:hypothetical protein [Breznakia pachnodae]MDQ0362479.1 hypothetical protein [Breznakia pachnodae]